MALSSYQAMPADEPGMLAVRFMVGALSLKAARCELLTWAAELTVRLDVDATTQVERIEYDA
jgi:hypothetical protein